MDFVSGNITAQNAAPTGTPTDGSALALELYGRAASATIQVTGTYTGAMTVQGRLGGGNSDWVTLGLTQVADGAQAADIASAGVGLFFVPVSGLRSIRVTALAAFTGSARVIIGAGIGSGVGVPAAP